MAASAYAALASLYNVLEQIQHPVRLRLFDRSQIETLREMVSFLLDFFSNYSKVVSDDTDVQDIVRLITNCAQEAEDSIDSHVVDHLTHGSADKAHIGNSSFCEDIDRVIQKIKRIKKAMVERIEEEGSSQTTQPSVSSLPTDPYGNKTMVGFDEHLDQIMDRLKGGHQTCLQIVPIVGMGGIGKTTLARNISHAPCFKDHFDVHIWFTISQEYNVQDILLGLLYGKEKLGDKKNTESSTQDIAELGIELHQKLFGQRYLIVLDDVWSTNVWDDLKFFFPDNQIGSRIIVTTRLSSVADSLGGHNSYSVDLLDNKQSWELFCGEVFGEESCHDPELEGIGKGIAKDCKGLPLAIIVIGGLLSKSNMTREYWEEVAKNVNSNVINSKDDDICLNILSLSYNHLPIHLKPCFLYMRIFPEDDKIKFSRLIQYWVGEGFVISKGGKSLEEAGEEYLEDLIGRNLIFINNQEDEYAGKMTKTCGIHDLLRDLCLREHHKENIFRITKICDSTNLLDYRNICFMCIDRDQSRTISLPLLPYDDLPNSFATCSLCDICGMICPRLYKLRWASVVDHPKHAFPLPTKLGFLDLRTKYFLSISLSRFWNLQNLIVDQECIIELPSEIWDMPQLRRVQIRYLRFRDPPVTSNDSKDSIILENLETLSYVFEFRCSEEILERIPNLKKLKIMYDEDKDFSYYLLHNLVRLHKLETLRIIQGFLNCEMIAFPRTLKKLNWSYPEFVWEEMSIIGLLPNLEVLQLNLYKCPNIGEEWNPVEGEFLQLKLLSISGSADLVHWNAEREHFPKLERLVLIRMESLQEIPPGIGEIDTLLSIRLENCLDSLVDSAKEIVEEQKSYGNEVLQLHIDN